MIYRLPENVEIDAGDIEIGENVTFGNNISIILKGKFRIGSYSHLGNDVHIRGNNVIIGKHFYHSSGLRVGGGGHQNPDANLFIGDRCTIHNNVININSPIYIGDDVGLSPEVSLQTHGYWLSVLEGFPASFAGIKIGNGVIIGYRSLVLMGVEIADKVVIGAQSVVAKSIDKIGVYAGNPARLIRGIFPLSDQEKRDKLYEIIKGYYSVATYHNIEPLIVVIYPNIFFKKIIINAETFDYKGEQDDETDDFRDYLRRWGIRIYTERPFISKFRHGEYKC